MLDGLAIGPDDHVVELGPGMGATAALALAAAPASYTGIERDEAAARRIENRLRGPARRCLARPADDTGLEDGTATVVYAEAMLSMQTDEGKQRILAEAHRLLRPGGRLGLHEMILVPDGMPDDQKAGIHADLTHDIRVRSRPLTAAEWTSRLEAAGFRVELSETAPMHLLEPGRFIRDEGIAGTARFLVNAARHPQALRRLASLRRTFRRHRDNLAALTMVATRQADR
jgi:SAM-dependent methyltransferase